MDNGGCSQNCINTIGSYNCSCNSGYLLDADLKSCNGKYVFIFAIVTVLTFYSISDINECTLGNGGCSQNCINTIGSYHCSCNSGYLLDADLKSCNGMYLVTFTMMVVL